MSAAKTLTGKASVTLAWSADKPFKRWEGLSFGSVSVGSETVTRLTGLDLSGKGLGGTVPGRINDLPYLKSLDLSDNKLTSPVPIKLTLRNLKRLDLSHNRLSGSLPDEAALPVGLTTLDLSHNKFSGSIPKGLGKLTSLTVLDLSNNRLSGPIPPELGKLSKLAALNLSNNLLSGRVPEVLGRLPQSIKLSLVGNKFTGCVPSRVWNLSKSDSKTLGLERCIATMIKPPHRPFGCLGVTRRSSDEKTATAPNGSKHIARVELWARKSAVTLISPKTALWCIQGRIINQSSPVADAMSWSGNIYRTDAMWISIEVARELLKRDFDKAVRFAEPTPPAPGVEPYSTAMLKCQYCRGGTAQTANMLEWQGYVIYPTAYFYGSHSFTVGTWSKQLSTATNLSLTPKMGENPGAHFGGIFGELRRHYGNELANSILEWIKSKVEDS